MLSTTPFSIPPHSLFVILGLLTVGCFEDLGPLPNDEVGEEDGTTGSPGPCWCATVEDAEVDPTAGPSEPIVDPLNDDGSPKDCVGTNEDVHSDLLALDGNLDNLVVVTSMQSALVPFRDEVFDEAESYCDDLADAQGGGGSTNDCNGILVAGTSPIEYDDERLCMIGFVEYEPPPDTWADYFDLEEVIEHNPTNGVYEIDEEFFDAMLHNLWWITGDSAYIALNGNLDFAFFAVDSRDVVYALGIASGDVPQTLNAYDVTSILEVSQAYMALWTETEFEFVVNRPGVGTVTLNYEIVP